MQDDNPTLTMPMEAPARRRRSGGRQFLLVLLAFLIGAALVAYLAWHGELARYLPAGSGTDQLSATGGGGSTATGKRGVAAPGTAPVAVGSLEMRLAMLEDRFSRLDFEARAASGNAGRAEALLLASAARRTIERGEPLGPLADQLRLRFSDAQPAAIETITTFSRNPVTIDQLSARLEALAPDLTDNSQDTNWWERAREEVTSLFMVRSDSPTLLKPAARIERARLMLTARRIGSAIDEVERLPGAEAANTWIADARRFDEARRALDLIETTAILEPRALKDGSGQDVSDQGPLAATQSGLAPDATPAATPTPTPMPTSAEANRPT